MLARTPMSLPQHGRRTRCVGHHTEYRSEVEMAVEATEVVRAAGAEEAWPNHSSAASMTDKISVNILQH